MNNIIIKATAKELLCTTRVQLSDIFFVTEYK